MKDLDNMTHFQCGRVDKNEIGANTKSIARESQRCTSISFTGMRGADAVLERKEWKDLREEDEEGKDLLLQEQSKFIAQHM